MGKGSECLCKYASKGEYLARYGSVAREMFFVGKGVVSVLAPNGGDSVVNAIKVGSICDRECFGEVALIISCLRPTWARADTYVQAPILERASLEPIWKFFPQERERFIKRFRRDLGSDAAAPCPESEAAMYKYIWKIGCDLRIAVVHIENRKLSLP